MMKTLPALLCCMIRLCVFAQHDGLQYRAENGKEYRVPLQTDVVLRYPDAHKLHAKLVLAGDSFFVTDRLGRIVKTQTFSFSDQLTLRRRQPLRFTAGGVLIGASVFGTGYVLLYRGIAGGNLNQSDKRVLSAWTAGSMTSLISGVLLISSVSRTYSRPGTVTYYDKRKEAPPGNTHKNKEPFAKPLNYLFADIGSLHTAGIYYDRHFPLGNTFCLAARAGAGFERQPLPVLGLGVTTQHRVAPELLVNGVYAAPRIQAYYHDNTAFHAALTLGATVHFTNHFFIRPNTYLYLGEGWVMGGPAAGLGLAAGGCF